MLTQCVQQRKLLLIPKNIKKTLSSKIYRSISWNTRQTFIFQSYIHELVYLPSDYFKYITFLSIAFESEFCKLRQEVDILKDDDIKVANNELEISKLYHKLQTETKNIADIQKDVGEMKQNLTKTVRSIKRQKGKYDMLAFLGFWPNDIS